MKHLTVVMTMPVLAEPESVYRFVAPAKHVGVRRLVCRVFGHSRFLLRHPDADASRQRWRCVRCNEVALVTGDRRVTVGRGKDFAAQPRPLDKPA